MREFLSLDERNAKKSAGSDDSGVETSSGNESADGRQAARSSEDDESDESRPGSAVINILSQRSMPIAKGNINLGPSERP